MDQAAIDQLAAFQKNDPAGWADMLSQLGMSGGDGDEDGDGPGAGVPPALAELLATANTGSAPSREPGGPVGEDELRMPGGGGVLGSDGKARSNQAGIDITPLAGYVRLPHACATTAQLTPSPGTRSKPSGSTTTRPRSSSTCARTRR